MVNKETYCCLVLGGYVNGYSIIQELSDRGIENVALFDYWKSIGSKSNKVKDFTLIDKTENSLKQAIFELKEKCDYIVIYPTDDLQLENLSKIYDDIKEFCFVPFNQNNILKSLDKFFQYEFCEKFNIPYPKTKNVERQKDLDDIEKMQFPVLVKPNKRDDITTNVFRSLFLKNKSEFLKNKLDLQFFIEKGQTFIFSEYIPGDDTNIYAYVGYRSKKGVILNEWIGKKLNQYPDKFGVFSSASNEAPLVVKEQGRKLLEVMDLYGIAEPEFKYDKRDGKYKLMEINLRSMMWHRVGNLSGVNIQYTQYLDALGFEIPIQEQDQDKVIHFSFLTYEIINLFFRKKYCKCFIHNVLGGRKVFLALYDKKDLKPFIYSLFELIKLFVKKCLKR